MTGRPSFTDLFLNQLQYITISQKPQDKHNTKRDFNIVKNYLTYTVTETNFGVHTKLEFLQSNKVILQLMTSVWYRSVIVEIATCKCIEPIKSVAFIPNSQVFCSLYISESS